MKVLSTSLGCRGRLTTSHSQSRASAETSRGGPMLGQAPPPPRASRNPGATSSVPAPPLQGPHSVSGPVFLFFS